MNKHINAMQEPEKQDRAASGLKKFRNAFIRQSSFSRQASIQIILQYALSLIIYPLVCIVIFLVGANG